MSLWLRLGFGIVMTVSGFAVGYFGFQYHPTEHPDPPAIVGIGYLQFSSLSRNLEQSRTNCLQWREFDSNSINRGPLCPRILNKWILVL